MKRIISLLLVFALLLPCMGLKAEAKTTSGTCGTNVKWSFDSSTGTLTISGKGPMDDYRNSDTLSTSPWHKKGFIDDIKNVVIEPGVTSIGALAFYCGDVESVTIPSTVKKINAYAFYGCCLKGLKLPDGLKTIGSAAFGNGNSMKTVKIPGSVTTINVYAFGGTKLNSVILEEGVTTIERNAFKECYELTTVALPGSVTTIDSYAFAYCEELKDVYYALSEKDRGEMDISNGSAYLEKATWHYNSSAPDITPDTPRIRIAGSAVTGKTSLSWNAVSGADFYRIYRSTSHSGKYTYQKSTTSCTYTDTTATIGQNYYYKILAVNEDSGKTSEYSNIVNRVRDLRKPTVSLSVRTATGKPVVKWESVKGAEKYRIYRSANKTSGYTQIASVTSGTSYIDTTAKAGVNYYYKLKAIHSNSAADSVFSEPVNRVCDLAKPDVTIRLKDGDPRLTWEKSSGAEKYYVYRATSKNGEYTHVKTTVTASSFTDTTAKAGKTYYYKVMAIHEKEAANSAYSSVKSITAK